ncbi:hypothetical protein AK812_SmicGene21112 [Symbiodinium microadriaticum]|uniref:Uncharacterized protein n=1 Tax=Symbiodinium microadriaticum TaxID=2951 RepID=A0A1Q9DNB3_SYMMI|nr:hypothetical protein AK812_SmicGene21112 [Symbiodinium microadriaticum]
MAGQLWASPMAGQWAPTRHRSVDAVLQLELQAAAEQPAPQSCWAWAAIVSLVGRLETTAGLLLDAWIYSRAASAAEAVWMPSCDLWKGGEGTSLVKDDLKSLCAGPLLGRLGPQLSRLRRRGCVDVSKARACSKRHRGGVDVVLCLKDDLKSLCAGPLLGRLEPQLSRLRRRGCVDASKAHKWSPWTACFQSQRAAEAASMPSCV